MLNAPPRQPAQTAIRRVGTLPVTSFRAGVDTTVIALWLGHEQVQTTAIYLHADLTIKERALARLAAPTTPVGRYRPSDSLLAFLDAL